MSFPEEVKIKALVACGRKCCICHKFCGNNMEIHHIHPHAQGGEDTFENAIPLCFDCHATVGQYNPKHPKGTKFSEKELIAHRDEWYKKIKNEKTTNSVRETLESIKVYKTPTSEPKSLLAVSSGKELMSYAKNASALEFDYDEPETEEEQDLILKTVDLIQTILDEVLFMDLTQSMAFSFELSNYINQLSDMNYLIFTGKANRIVKGGIEPPNNFTVWLIHILKKDNPNIVKYEGENI